MNFARKVGTPILGVVENMSYLICPHCGGRIEVFGSGGGERIAREMDVPFLGSIPLDPRISLDSDRGVPFVIEHSDTPAAKAFMEIVEKIKQAVEGKEDA